MSRILVADDERDMTWALSRSLSDEGYEVLTTFDGLEALRTARRHRPDLVILDIVMPRMDGLQVCRSLRQDPALNSVPILFLTARRAIEDRVKGLDGGGNDYLAKPFDLRELKARVRVLLRRNGPTRDQGSRPEGRGSLLVMGPFTLDLHARQVCLDSKARGLTPVEFDLLHYLLVHRGEVFSSQQLLQQVWGYPPKTGDVGLVRWHIKNLRAKIEPNPTCPVYIRTVPHHGYILVQPSSVRPTQAAPGASAVLAGRAGAALTPPEPL